MTIAPSAGIGKSASTGRRNSNTMTTQTTATSECSWVRAPADSPIAVRLPLLLTGNPWNSPAPTFAAPRARNSWLASVL